MCTFLFYFLLAAAALSSHSTASLADSGHFHAPVVVAAAASASAPHDFRNFESTVLEQWIEQFKASEAVPASDYAYSFFPHDRSTSSLYGTTDVLNIRYLTNTLNLSTGEADAYAAHINSFQNETTGFFDTLPEESLAGFQPWHSSGYATSALLLINRNAARQNQYYQSVARNESAWGPTFLPLLEGPFPVPGVGCDSVHSCAHKLVAVPAVLLMANFTPRPTLQPLLDWWFTTMESHLDNTTGEWCPPQQHVASVSACLGAGMAVHALYNAVNRPWPLPSVVRDFALGLQGAAGVPGLWADSLNNWLNLDGVFQAARAANATGGPELHTRVRGACDAFLALAAEVLNNATAVLDTSPLARGGGLSKDTHGLPGVVTAVAECAKWFPDLVVTARPWRQGVDKGPYP